MKNLKTFGFLAALLLLTSWTTELTAQAPAGGIDFFHGSFEEAKQKARKENKLIFLDAYASWCGPCKQMAREAFTNPQVGSYFNSHFINLKMDMERGEGPRVARQLRVMAYPSLFFMKGDGKVVHRTVGKKNAEALLSLGKQAEGKK